MTYKLKIKFLSRRIYRRLKNQSDRWSGCYYSLLCFHLDHVISYNALARKPTYATKQGQGLGSKGILIGLVTDSSEVSSIVQLVTEQFSVTAHLWPNLVCRVPPQTGGHCRKVGCTVKKNFRRFAPEFVPLHFQFASSATGNRWTHAAT